MSMATIETKSGVRTIQFSGKIGIGATEELPIAEETTFGYVKTTETVTEETPTGKFLYNGVLLPEIPADTLANYPYCMIRDDTVNNGRYDLIMAELPFTFNGTDRLVTSGTAKPSYMYLVNVADIDSADSWTLNKTTIADIGIAAPRVIIWANFDIPIQNSTEIYLEATEPVAEYGTVTETITHYGPVERESNYSITSESLNDIAKRTQEMAGTSKLLTPDEIIYWLGRVMFIPQGRASSEFALPVFGSATSSRLPEVVKTAASSEFALPVFESSAVGALQEG